MKKHIVLIVENNSVPDDIRVWNEAVAAREFGYDVSVISPRKRANSPLYEELEGIHIYRHYMPIEASGKIAFLVEYSNAIFWEFLISLWIFFRNPFHIIHSANPPDHVFIIALFYKLFGVKYIFDHHDITPENYVAKFNRKDFLFRFLLFMEKMTFKAADVIISTNNSYKKIALDRGNKKNNDVFVVRNGPNLSKVIFSQPNEKLKEGFDYLVVYVGVIGNQEGIDNLLSAVRYLVEEKNVHNILFKIIGTGPHWNAMVGLTKELKLDKYVHFTGFIPYKDFYEIIASSDLCVNPEYRNEFTNNSTMLKIMDYMVMGKPIVMFETTEGKVTADKAASYIQKNDYRLFANKIVELLEDEQKRISMSKIGKQRINDKLNWDIQKVNLKKAYLHLENKSK